MPLVERVDAIYEYRCRKCGNVFEEWVKTFDSPELEPAPNAAAMPNGSFPIRLLSLKAAAGSRPAMAGNPVPPAMPPRLGTRPGKG